MVPICWPFIPSSGHCSHGALGPAGAAHLALLHGGSLLAPNPAPFLQHLTVGQKLWPALRRFHGTLPLAGLDGLHALHALQGLHGLHWVLLRGVLAGLVGARIGIHSLDLLHGAGLEAGHGNNGRTDKPSVLAQSFVN